jgi:hypothetical protein
MKAHDSAAPRYCTANSSISKISVALPGIAGGLPWEP